jgi:hypothetical protein
VRQFRVNVLIFSYNCPMNFKLTGTYISSVSSNSYLKMKNTIPHNREQYKSEAFTRFASPMLYVELFVALSVHYCCFSSCIHMNRMTYILDNYQQKGLVWDK